MEAKACPSCGHDLEHDRSFRLAGNKIRGGAKARGAAWPPGRREPEVAIAVTLIVLMVLFFIATRTGCGGKRSTSGSGNSTSHAGRVGKIVRLRVPGASSSDPVFLGRTAGDLSALYKANRREGWAGATRLIAAGRVFTVPNGTRCKILDPGVFSTKVRVLEGSRQGETGYIDSEYAK